MADSREIIGWFYKNGRRIPIKAKKGSGEKDLESASYNGQEVSKGSIIDIPGGKGTVERLYETSNPELLYKNRIKVKNTDTEEVSDFAFGKDLNPNYGKSSVQMPGREDIRQRALEHKVDKTDQNEVLFINNRRDPVRKHAEIVSELPEKTGKFDLGYSKMGTYQYDHGTYDIHHDRNRFDQFSYYAVPKIGKENVKRDPVNIRRAIKQPGAQAIRRVMQERGLTRQEAIKYLMEQRKKG